MTPTSPARREALDAAYRATSYRVGKLTLRVGEPHPWLDRLLEDRGLERYAYLTSANPASAPLPAAKNAVRMRALAEALAGFVVLRGVAEADDAAWEPEPSFLVLGISRDDAAALGRAFGQNAILVGKRGGAPELLWL